MKERYQRIKQLAGEHSVKALCQTLRVSRTGYYAWRQGRADRRAREDAKSPLCCSRNIYKVV